MASKCILKLKSGTKGQLVCFPYLGGHMNAFQPLAAVISSDFEVLALNLPGHGVSDSLPLDNLHSLIMHLYEQLKGVIKPGCLFLGHSMGAVVAYFLLQEMVKNNDFSSIPSAIIISASNPPSYFKNKDVSSKSNDEIIAQVLSYGGISAQVLGEKSLLQYFVPVYRSDFKLLESSANSEYQLLNLPAYVLWGERDQVVSIEQALNWQNYFSSEIKLIPVMDGTHMFINDQAAYIARLINEIYNKVLKDEKSHAVENT